MTFTHGEHDVDDESFPSGIDDDGDSDVNISPKSRYKKNNSARYSHAKSELSKTDHWVAGPRESGLT